MTGLFCEHVKFKIQLMPSEQISRVSQRFPVQNVVARTNSPDAEEIPATGNVRQEAQNWSNKQQADGRGYRSGLWLIHGRRSWLERINVGPQFRSMHWSTLRYPSLHRPRSRPRRHNLPFLVEKHGFLSHSIRANLVYLDIIRRSVTVTVIARDDLRW